MSENKARRESLTSLEIHVDPKERVHSFTDRGERWIFMKPIALVDLMETYAQLVEATEEGLTSLEIQVDPEGQVHSYTDANKRWTFMSPIALVDLMKTYKKVLANVDMEPVLVRAGSLPTPRDRVLLRP